MIYNTMLDYFGFMVSSEGLQKFILTILGIITICTFKFGKRTRIKLGNFIPILLILSLTVLNRLIYFFTMVDISDQRALLKLICIAAIFIFIGCKFGIFWVANIFSTILKSIFITPLRVISVGAFIIFSFLLNTPIIQDASIFIAIFIIIRKPICIQKFRFWIYLTIGIILSLMFGPVLAIELILLARCLELCIINSKLLGIFHWVLFFMVGFFLNYLILLVFAHIWLSLGVFLLLRWIYKTIS